MKFTLTCCQSISVGHLFPGYTSETRRQSRVFLHTEQLYHKLTAIEEPLLAQFGSEMAQIIRDVLSNWAKATQEMIRSLPGLRPIYVIEKVDIIMEFLMKYDQQYVLKFGWMDNFSVSPIGEVKDNTVCIRSTAYGTKIFLGLLMADRIQIMDLKRRDERERIGFEELINSELAEDSENCPICQEVMGVHTPKDTKKFRSSLLYVVVRFLEKCGM